MSQIPYTQTDTSLGSISASTFSGSVASWMPNPKPGYLALTVTSHGVQVGATVNVYIKGVTAASNKAMNGYYLAYAYDANTLYVPAAEQLWGSGGTVNTYVRTLNRQQPANSRHTLTFAAPADATTSAYYFKPGEKITGATSGATARVIGYVSPLVANIKAVKGTFGASEVVAGSVYQFVGVGSIATTTLTVTSVTSGVLLPGMSLPGVTTPTTIVNQLTGVTGAAGTYTVADSQTYASGAVVATVSATSGSGTPQAVNGKLLRNVAPTSITGSTGNLAFVASTTGTAATQSTAANILNLSAATVALVNIGSTITGAGVTAGSGAKVVAYGTGTGGAGTYILDTPITTTNSAGAITITAASIVAASAGGFTTAGVGVGSVITVSGTSTSSGANSKKYVVTAVAPSGTVVTVDSAVVAESAGAFGCVATKCYVTEAAV